MPFTARLLLIPSWLLFLLMNLLLIGISLGLLFLVRGGLHYQVRERHNQVNGYIFTTAGLLYGVLIAFVVIFLWQGYEKAVEDASREGSQAMSLYRDLSLYPDPGQVEGAKAALLVFVRKVIEDEFPAMGRMQLSPATQRAINALWLNTQKIHPTNIREQVLFAEILGELNQLSKLRHGRLEQLNSNLPTAIWLALIAGALISILFAVLLGAQKFWLHTLLTCMLAILMATSFFVVIELDYPFMGEISAKPSSYFGLLEMVEGRSALTEGKTLQEFICGSPPAPGKDALKTPPAPGLGKSR